MDAVHRLNGGGVFNLLIWYFKYLGGVLKFY
jgi:hypothetical protein